MCGLCTGPVALVWLPPERQKILAMRLADDRAAGIEDALHHRRVDVGDIAFQRRRTVHHRHAGQHDVVLQHHGLALELAVGRACTVVLTYQALCLFSSPVGR